MTDWMARALAAYYRSPGALSPDGAHHPDPARCELLVTAAGRRYVVLRDTLGAHVATYRIRSDNRRSGQLQRLKRPLAEES